MAQEDNWLPDDLTEGKGRANFGTYEFEWGIATLDYKEERWIQIIPFHNQQEYLVDYYPRGTTFYVDPRGFRIETPKAKAFDPVALSTPIQ